MSKKVWYLAGPMSGLPNHGFDEFIKFENALRERGYTIVSPREITMKGEGKLLDKSWEWYLRNDLAEMLKCDGVILMPGWKRSRGARLECFVADKLKMRVNRVDGTTFRVYPTSFGDQRVFP